MKVIPWFLKGYNEMKRILFISIITVISFLGCKKDNADLEIPFCIETKINEFSLEACDNGANVKEYLFQNKTVYVFDPGTCGADLTSEVIDAKCTTLGFLGGFAGNIVINGELFDNAVFAKTIREL
jgi:hypothetical protein